MGGGVVDNFIRKLPGSIPVKAFLAGTGFCVALALPNFIKGDGQQGHDYFSSEKPEIVAQQQDKFRKELREQRRLEQAQKKQQQQGE